MKRLLENDSLLITLGIALLGFAAWACGSAEPAISPELKDRIPRNAERIIVTSSKSADEFFEEAKEVIKSTPCEIRSEQPSSRRILTRECNPGQSNTPLRIDFTVEETSDGSRLNAITQVRIGSDSWQDANYKEGGKSVVFDHAFEEATIIMNKFPGEISFETP